MIEELVGAEVVPILRALVDVLCRNSPERGLALFDAHSWACARCTGMYTGITAAFLLGSVFGLRSSRGAARWLFALMVLAATLNGVQVAWGGALPGTDGAGLRLVLGGLMGGAVGSILARQTQRRAATLALFSIAAVSGLAGLVLESGTVLNGAIALGGAATLLGLASLFLELRRSRR